MGESDEDRQGFIRKVYLILAVQLSITAVFIGLVTNAAYENCTYCYYRLIGE